uniref:Caveolin n=1 Tax=Romanomermis culicivorax TaxID=13658 RepID=A0A915K5H7_ROMCU
MHSTTETELEDASSPEAHQDDYLIIRGDAEHNLSSFDPYYSAIHSEDEAIKDKYDTATILNERSLMTEKEILRFVEDAAPPRNRGIYQKIRIWAEDSYHSTHALSTFSLLLYIILLLCFVAGFCVLCLNSWNFVKVAFVGSRAPIYDCSHAQILCNKCSCNCIRECGATRLQVVVSSLLRAYYVAVEGQNQNEFYCQCNKI